MKNILSITGIRPDFIRMSEIFKKLDSNFNHTLVHTGQHFDKLLSDVFFDELEIRKPDFNLEIGGVGKKHYHQVSELTIKIIELIESKNLNPDLILFLGDSNSVACSMSLKKEGFKIGHIEAGMRSYDKRMLEEINRTVCDHCSDYLFVYHEDYKKQLEAENIKDNVHVVGNTIVEVCNKYKDSLFLNPKKNDFILMDIHRPENFNYKDRLESILQTADRFSKAYSKPVLMLKFKRTLDKINEFSLKIPKTIELIDLMSYKNFLQAQYDSFFIFSDSGTSQEEPALLNTPVVVPRDFTERPQSMKYNCSYLYKLNNYSSFSESCSFLNVNAINSKWLGDGETSEKIIEVLK